MKLRWEDIREWFSGEVMIRNVGSIVGYEDHLRINYNTISSSNFVTGSHKPSDMTSYNVRYAKNDYD